MNAPTINAPSIASSAVLIDLSISTWTGRKLDKRASNDVTASNNAAKGVANVHKKLLGDCAELMLCRSSRPMHATPTTP